MLGRWPRSTCSPISRSRSTATRWRACAPRSPAASSASATVVHLHGGGLEGVGEDVVYDAEDHVALQEAGPVHDLVRPLHARRVLRADRLARPVPGRAPDARSRGSTGVWAFHSAALDLALRQAGLPLHAALGREPRRCATSCSLRLGEPPTLEPVQLRLALDPTLRFKLDATSSWTPELIAALVATGAVDSIDFKALYRGTIVDQAPDPMLYRRVVEAFPDAWLEDPDVVDPATAEVLAGAPRPDHLGRADPLDRRHRGAPVRAADGQHQAVADRRPGEALRDLRLLRRAPDRRLRRRSDRARARAAARRSTSRRCSIPTRPNDLAPSAYNEPQPPPGLPPSPLAPSFDADRLPLGRDAERQSARASRRPSPEPRTMRTPGSVRVLWPPTCTSRRDRLERSTWNRRRGTIATDSRRRARSGDVLLWARSESPPTARASVDEDCARCRQADPERVKIVDRPRRARARELPRRGGDRGSLQQDRRCWQTLAASRRRDGTVIATTTSSLSIHELAAATGRPERFAGLHVFNPVPRMELVELVFPHDASEDTRERSRELCVAMGKTPVEVPDIPGFVVNRLLFPYLFDAVELMSETGLSARGDRHAA